LHQLELLSELTSDGDFNSLLMIAVDRALVDTMGESVSRAVKACLELSTITSDPNRFSAQLQKFSGGTNLIEMKIMRNIAAMIDERKGASTLTEGRDLGQFIESCRGQFNHR